MCVKPSEDKMHSVFYLHKWRLRAEKHQSQLMKNDYLKAEFKKKYAKVNALQNIVVIEGNWRQST